MTGKKLVVIGGGLIGGSLCLAHKRRRPAWEITCIDLPDRLASIEQAGVADHVGTIEDAPPFLEACDLVVLATPVEVILDMLDTIAPHLAPGTIVTDVGSTKTEITGKAKAILPEGVHFIGGHPMAGAEFSGIEAADPLLFNGRVFMLCPQQDTPADALLFLIDIVEDLNGRPVTIEPVEHDRIMATVSHMPHLLAIALMHAALEDDAAHGMLGKVAGQGFLDVTRIAASEFGIWGGILKTNKKAILAAVDQLERSLAIIRGVVEREDAAKLWHEVSQERRRMDLSRSLRMRGTDLRKNIDSCDEEVLKALGRRLAAVRKIGKLKKNRNAPVYDPDRERRLMKDRDQWGSALGIPRELTESLFSLVMSHSKKMQSDLVE